MNKLIQHYNEDIKKYQNDKLLQRIVLAWEYVKDIPHYDFADFEEFLDYLSRNQFDELVFILDRYSNQIKNEIEEIKKERIRPTMIGDYHIVGRLEPVIRNKINR